MVRRGFASTRGAALLLTFLMMLVLSGLALAVGVFAQNSLVGGRSQLLDVQAFSIAHAGLERARQALVAETWSAATSPGNAYTESFGAGEYTVTVVDNGDSTYTITSEAYIPDQTDTIAKRKATAASMTVSTGASNKSPDAAASASSSKGSNTPDKGNDEDTGTHWQANTKGSGEWLAMDFGSTTNLNRVIVKESNRIDGVNVQWSDDGSSWTDVSGLSVTESPAKTWTADFTAANKRHFRGVFTASGSNFQVSVEEFESYDTTDTTLSFTNDGEFTTEW